MLQKLKTQRKQLVPECLLMFREYEVGHLSLETYLKCKFYRLISTMWSHDSFPYYCRSTVSWLANLVISNILTKHFQLWNRLTLQEWQLAHIIIFEHHEALRSHLCASLFSVPVYDVFFLLLLAIFICSFLCLLCFINAVLLVNPAHVLRFSPPKSIGPLRRLPLSATVLMTCRKWTQK